MKNFRRLYRTSSVEENISQGIGTCIEQVYLMSMLLNNLNISNKMYCTRVYESRDFGCLEAEWHIHCFVLYYLDGKVYQIEHPNWEKVGIYEYESEEEAIDKINEYYVNMSKGCARPVTQFYEVELNMSFKDFNNYINSLESDKIYKS